MRAVAAAQQRWRGVAAVAVAAEPRGKEAGEGEEVIGELTAVRFEAEDGPERELGVEGEARGGRR